MALLICGSAKIRENANASRPATAPASTPRRMSFFSMPGVPPRCPLSPGLVAGLVAGEAEEMTGVVHELVDHEVAAEHRGGALVDADEVIDGQRDERGPGQPQGRLRQ